MTTVLHVALTGEDNNPGSKEEPLATLHGARDRLRSCEFPAEVVFHEGTHYLPEPLELCPEDAGSTYRAADGERVTLSGGVKLNWGPKDPKHLCCRGQ